MKNIKWIASSMVASLFSMTPVMSFAEEIVFENDPPVNYLVSLQDSAGNHVCNGSYIGNGQVLTSPNCQYTITFPSPIPIPGPIDGGPIIIEPGGPILGNIGDIPISTLPSNTALNTSASLESEALSLSLNTPSYAVFLLESGESDPILLEGYFFSAKRSVYPAGGGAVLYTLKTVPAEAEAIEMADDELIDELLSDANNIYRLVGRNMQSNDILNTQFTSSSSCDHSKVPFKRSLCMTSNESRFCSIFGDGTLFEGTMGAPLVFTKANGEQVMMGFRPNGNCGSSSGGDSYMASSNYPLWSNLYALNQQGLSVVSAHEFGTQKQGSHLTLNVTFRNDSETEAFNLGNFSLSDRQAISVKHNNCDQLLPSLSCSVTLHSRVPDALDHLEQLSFTVNDQDAGVYVALSGYQEHKFKGDKGSHWRMTGWSKGHNDNGRHHNRHEHRSRIISIPKDTNTNPTLVRQEYVSGPTQVTVTYRTTGGGAYSLAVYNQRKSLSDISSPLTIVNDITLPATNGEWETGSIEINDLGSHEISLKVRKDLVFPGSGGEWPGDIELPSDEPVGDIEIKNICIGECDD